MLILVYVKLMINICLLFIFDQSLTIWSTKHYMAKSLWTPLLTIQPYFGLPKNYQKAGSTNFSRMFEVEVGVEELKYPKQTFMNTFGMNWNTECSLSLFTQHQRLTSLLLFYQKGTNPNQNLVECLPRRVEAS